MTRVSAHLAPLMVVAVLIAPTACHRVAPSGSLRVAVALGNARSLIPAGDYTPVDYLLEGVGPAGAVFTVTVTQTTSDIADLAAGTWTVSAMARNAAGDPVAAGESTAVVTPDVVTPLTITLQAPVGEGQLELAVLWTPQAAPSPLLTVDLLDTAGASHPLQPVYAEAPGEAAVTATGLASGWCTLLVRLYDSDTLVAGLAEAALIRASVTTVGTLDLRGVGPAGAGALSATLTLDTPAVEPVLLAGQHRILTPGRTIRLETYPPPTGWQGWFLDGQLVGNDSAHILSAPATFGEHRLDAVRISGSRAGHAGCAFQVQASVTPGTLTRVFDLVDGDWGAQGLRGTRAAALSPDGQWLYATGYDSDRVAVFRRSPETGLVCWTGCAQAPDGPEGLVLDPEGRYLYVAGYTSDTVWAYRCLADGVLEQIATYDGLDGARALSVSPDGRHVYAALAAADALAVLERDAGTGLLVPTGAVSGGESGLTALVTPTDLAISADGLHLYVTCYGGDAVLWFLRDPATGLLTWLGEVRDGVDLADGLNGAHGIALSADGAWVYAASYFDDTLVVMERDASTGALAAAERHTDGVGGVDGMVYARDVAVCGETVYVAGSGDDAVAVFRRVPEGGLQFQAAVTTPDSPRGLAVSPDGGSLYVCSSGVGALTHMAVAP